MNRGAWQATVHGVWNGWIGLKRLSMHTPEQALPMEHVGRVLQAEDGQLQSSETAMCFLFMRNSREASVAWGEWGMVGMTRDEAKRYGEGEGWQASWTRVRLHVGRCLLNPELIRHSKCLGDASASRRRLGTCQERPTSDWLSQSLCFHKVLNL